MIPARPRHVPHAVHRCARWTAFLCALALAGAGPVAARVRPAPGVPFARVHTADRLVALSFDDGPGANDSPDSLLALLASRNAHGTFFLIGEELARRPEIAKRLLAAGDEIANHSWSHPRLDTLAAPARHAELARSDSLLHALGAKGRPLFRPPFGAYDSLMVSELRRDRRTVALFDVDLEYDFPGVTDPDSLAARTVLWLGPGSILVVHPWYGGGGAQLAVLPRILDWLERLGYRIVTVSELLARAHGTAEPSLYHRPE